MSAAKVAVGWVATSKNSGSSACLVTLPRVTLVMSMLTVTCPCLPSVATSSKAMSAVKRAKPPETSAPIWRTDSARVPLSTVQLPVVAAVGAGAAIASVWGTSSAATPAPAAYSTKAASSGTFPCRTCCGWSGAVAPRSIRSRVASLSIRWCFSAPAMCNRIARPRSLVKTQCAAAKVVATPSVCGTKGKVWPKGHRIGAKPVTAAWWTQPVSGTATSEMYSSQCTALAKVSSALRSGCRGAG